MAKEWLLNSVANRFQLNFKRNVGAVSESIRKCQPKNIEVWREYYYANVRSKEHIDELGRKLYTKITEVIASEVEDITEEDCIIYMHNLVTNRTFDGYFTEIKTIYGQLQEILGEKIVAAPDEWDRLYNVDFYIEINGKYVGIQVKPVSDVTHIPQMYKEKSIQQSTHQGFKERYGGSVFYIYSKKDGQKKVIHNTEVIAEIQQEILRLKKES